jgi:hypothetical protein
MDSLFPFIRRQTFFGFLYNPGFELRNRIVTVVYNVMLIGAFVLACVAASWGNRWAIPLGFLLASYVALILGSHLLADANLAEKHRSCGKSIRRPDTSWAMLLLICLPFSLLISLAAVISTLRVPCITWRGVRYRIRGPWRIEKIEADSVIEQPDRVDEQLDLTLQP